MLSPLRLCASDFVAIVSDRAEEEYANYVEQFENLLLFAQDEDLGGNQRIVAEHLNFGRNDMTQDELAWILPIAKKAYVRFTYIVVGVDTSSLHPRRCILCVLALDPHRCLRLACSLPPSSSIHSGRRKDLSRWALRSAASLSFDRRQPLIGGRDCEYW